jgi:hypothetical protein
MMRMILLPMLILTSTSKSCRIPDHLRHLTANINQHRSGGRRRTQPRVNRSGQPAARQSEIPSPSTTSCWRGVVGLLVIYRTSTHRPIRLAWPFLRRMIAKAIPFYMYCIALTVRPAACYCSLYSCSCYLSLLLMVAE